MKLKNMIWKKNSENGCIRSVRSFQLNLRLTKKNYKLGIKSNWVGSIKYVSLNHNNVELLEQQWEKLMAEKEEAIQDLERSFKRKLIDAETKFR